MKTFLIVGGRGKVGSRLAGVLRGAGHGVRISSRSGGDVRFDWREPGTYAPALHGVDGVFLVGPGSATDWSPALGQLLNVAASEGVKRAVLLSARGVEFLPDGAVGRAEKTLAAGPIPWTVLRPSHFAQNFTEAMFVPVNEQILAPVAMVLNRSSTSTTSPRSLPRYFPTRVGRTRRSKSRDRPHSPSMKLPQS